MRYDKIIYLINEGNKEYNPITSQYEESKQELIKKYAHISTVNLENQIKIIGEIKSELLTIRIQGMVKENPESVMIDNKKYKVIKKKKLRHDTSFFIQRSENGKD